MHTSLQFLAQKLVLLVGIALFILANPFTYLVVGVLILIVTGANTSGVSFDTQDRFIQAMNFVSIIGAVIIVVSRVSAWILAFQEIKARSTK
jgi:hypothetical protein